jgi:hypothetical protein
MSQVPRASATHRGGAENARTRVAGDRVHGHALTWEIKTQTLNTLAMPKQVARSRSRSVKSPKQKSSTNLKRNADDGANW